MDERAGDKEGAVRGNIFFERELEGFVRGEEGAGGGDGDADDGANPLVESPVEGAGSRAVGIFVQALEVGGLDAGFECVEGVDEKVYGEGCECTSLGKRL